MTLLWQTGLVLRRRILLQGLRRHYVKVALELFVVLSFVAVQVATSRRVPPGGALARMPRIVFPPEPLRALLGDKRSNDSSALAFPGYRIVYAPQTDYARRLVKEAFPEPENEFLPVDSWDEVADKCGDSGSRRSELPRVCVMFSEGAEGKVPSLGYSVLIRSWNLAGEKIELPTSFLHGIDPQRHYVLETIMSRVERAQISLQNKASLKPVPIDLFIRQFPWPSLPQDGPAVVSHISLSTSLLVMGFVGPFLFRVSSVVYENSAEMKWIQLSQGLHEMAHWLGQLGTCLAFTLLDSVMAVLCLLYVNTESSLPVFEKTDVTLLAFVFFLFSCMFTLHVVLFACFFRTRTMAVTVGILYYMGIDVLRRMFSWDPKLPLYLSASKRTKMASALSTLEGTSLSLMIMTIFESFNGTAGWHIIDRPALDLDNVTLEDVWLAMAASFPVFLIAIWYLANALPTLREIPRPFYFPVTNHPMTKLSYWRPVHPTPRAGRPIKAQDGNLFEPAPEGAKAVISVEALTKVYGSSKALVNVNLEIYEGQLTVLLGQNGAGKTSLINIIAGLQRATGGIVRVRGNDPTMNVAAVRETMSFCPQKNFNFSDMTVREHLIYFGKLRRVSSPELQQRLKEVLQSLKLTQEADVLAGRLSDAMQRRLNVAIALMSKPKLMILDEPSTGMDPMTRRDLWHVLLALRGSCTLLLSTHDMEEADVIGDRIVILSRGKVTCAGSPSFLKEHVGAGYRINLSTNPATFDARRTLDVIRTAAPAAEITQIGENETRISLNVMQSEGFGRMFELLEENSGPLGIERVNITAPRMEDVFFKANIEELIVDASISGEDKALVSGDGNRPTALHQARALITKRVVLFSRNWFTTAIAWIVPMLVFALLFHAERELLKLDEVPRLAALSLPGLYPSAAAFVQEDSGSRDLASTYREVARDQGATVEVFEDAETYLLELGEKDFAGYVHKFVAGAMFAIDRNETGKVRAEGWYSSHADVSSLVAINLLTTAVLRNVTGDTTARINVTLVSAGPSQGTIRKLKELGSFVILEIMSLVLTLVVGLLVSVFALQPVVERASRSKDLQLVTGISSFLYWSSHFLFDVVIYTTCWVLASIIFFQQHSIRADSIGAVVALVLSFPFVALPTAYLTSFVVKSQSLAATIVVVAFSASGITRIHTDPNDHSWVSFLWTLVPPYAFPGSLMNVLAIDRRNSICDAMRRKWHLQNGSFSEACPQPLFACCSDYQNTTFWYTISPLGFHRHGVGLVCLSMLLEGVLLFALLSCLDSGIHVFRYSLHGPTPTSSSENLDANVKKEKEAVREMCSTGDFKGVALAVDDLSKWYGSRHAVRGLSFALKNHQCLGLLGVNGAGKTTVFQMLSGIVPCSGGEAHMQGLTLSRNRRAWQSNIGYCPQYDGLMNRLTAYEQLRLFARLRGVSSDLVERAVTRVVWMVGLEEWACKQCCTYSGGNKRKLSIAMAIIGVPKLLLLDESMSGVDAIVRRRILTGLRLAMESLDVAVVFGTHSVQECEALCDTVGVMAAGELKFLGSFGSLKGRFQTGCIVRFKLNVDDQHSSLVAAVSEELPGIDLREAHEGTLVFHLKQGVPWSVLFDKLDRLRETFAIEEAIVSDMTSGHALSTLSSGELDALSFGRS